MVGPPFSLTLKGGLFYGPPMEDAMEATTVFVIVMIFISGMSTLMFILNHPSKDGSQKT
jgi:hypothetical protein